jgi:lipoprotein-releasing system permease protein
VKKGFSLEWFIARRYLSSRKGARFLSLITLIAIGGVTVGVMALVVVTAVMSGLQNELRNKYLGTNPHIWLTTYGEGMRLDAWQGTLARVLEVDGVVSAAPFVETAVALRLPNAYAEAGLMRGIDPDAKGEAITEIVTRIRNGEFSFGPTASGYPPLVLGDGLAEKFQAYAGTVIDVISLQGTEVNSLGILQPPMRRFEVVGSFHTGMYDYDNRYMYTTLSAAQDLARLGDAVTGLEIRTPDPNRAEPIARDIEAHLGGFPYRGIDWMSLNKSLFQALELEKLAMAVILLLIVVVAAFNIISTLVMVVADKTREIGILKSMGLTARQVQRIFMIQGVVIGFVGAAIGASGGLILAWVLNRYQLIKIPGEVYFIPYLPVEVDPLELTVVLLASLLISFLATIYPARKAARLFPVEAIRHE